MEFWDELNLKYKEKIEETKKSLAYGNASSYDEYRQAVGLIEGASITAKAEDSERDRESKKAIAAMEALLELADTEANIDRDKTLKAADMLGKFISDTNKG